MGAPELVSRRGSAPQGAAIELAVWPVQGRGEPVGRGDADGIVSAGDPDMSTQTEPTSKVPQEAVADDGEGGTTSPWMDVVVPVLQGSGDTAAMTADVCVIGAGIAGLSTAYLLACEGRRVIVLDDGAVGGGETSRTTAHLASYLDDRFTVLEKLHGARGAELAAESHAAAIELIERICEKEDIDCDLRRVDGYLFRGADSPAELLDDELAASIRAGHISAEMVPRIPVPGYDSGPAIRFPRQAQFHPMKYMAGLAAAFERLGGRIFTDVHVDRIDKPQVEGGAMTVASAKGVSVVAGSVVVATNGPIESVIALPLKQAAYRTYAVALVVPRGAIPAALYWDTSEPYHYARITPGTEKQTTDLLVVGGEDHRTGQDDDQGQRFSRLEQWARARFPGIAAVVARWSGQVLEPADGLAFIGRVGSGDERVYVITGDSGHGMTHGTLGGVIVADAMAGRANRWADLYAPGRVTLRSAADFIKENANTALQYADWLLAGDVADVAQIPPGGGAIVRRGLHLLAVYRDEAGTAHEMSAACRHLGGVVRWNAVERSWDCPCHGARYDAFGKVICGPANRDLEPANPPTGRDGEPAIGAQPATV